MSSASAPESLTSTPRPTSEISDAITPRTRALVMNSPSNPSGAVYSRGELEGIATALRATEIIVISDEIYHRLTYDGQPFTSVASIPGMFDRTLTVNGA